MAWVPPPPPAVDGDDVDSFVAQQASEAARLLEHAYRAGDRDLALIWQRAMYDVVNLRRLRRFGPDTQTAKGCGS
jgi:hypothetical protein